MMRGMTVLPSASRSHEATTPDGRGPMHIVHAVLSLDFGGLERIVLDLTRAQADCGHIVSIVCIERPGTLAVEAERIGARVVNLAKPPGRVPATIQKANRALQSLKPDIIHSHQLGALWYVGQGARLCGAIPVLHTEHGHHLGGPLWSWQQIRSRLFSRRAARLAGRFCCVSDE